MAIKIVLPTTRTEALCRKPEADMLGRAGREGEVLSQAAAPLVSFKPLICLITGQRLNRSTDQNTIKKIGSPSRKLDAPKKSYGASLRLQLGYCHNTCM